MNITNDTKIKGILSLRDDTESKRKLGWLLHNFKSVWPKHREFVKRLETEFRRFTVAENSQIESIYTEVKSGQKDETVH